MSEKAKIVFFGSDAICLPGLRYLHEEAGDRCVVDAVVSQPDRRQGRGKRLMRNPVAAYAGERGLTLLQPEKPDRALAERLAAAGTAAGVVMAYGHFLPRLLREAPAHGMVNFHGSILPEYRGASPVETAIAEGETETGVCLMRVVKEMDAGGVADCERVCIEDSDTSVEVREKIGRAVRPLLERQLDALLAGELEFEPQDRTRASYCRKISKEDGAIDFGLSAKRIRDRLRAFTPWPGAYFEHGATRIRVGWMEALPQADAPHPPGTVVAGGEDLTVATGDGLVRFTTLQRPGGKLLPASDFLRGHPIGEGELLKGGKARPLVRKEP
ncbi:MAG: methionyl-tRNA formyltransferase [Verrucomicrobiota bacterium]